MNIVYTRSHSRINQFARYSRPGEPFGIEPSPNLEGFRRLRDGHGRARALDPKVTRRGLSLTVRYPLQQLIVYFLLLAAV